MPWIINEDDALKRHLRGLVVSDQNDAERAVGVWYRLPESEERAVTYPFVTIDLIDVQKEADREQRGLIHTAYHPEGYADPQPGFGHKLIETPTPVSLVYQITTFARSAWHDRQLTAQILGNVLPFRYGALEVPADNTIRRLDLLEWQSLDGLDQNDKRVFRKAYTVAVSAELFVDALIEVQKVASVGITVFHQLEPFIVEQVDA